MAVTHVKTLTNVTSVSDEEFNEQFYSELTGIDSSLRELASSLSVEPVEKDKTTSSFDNDEDTYQAVTGGESNNYDYYRIIADIREMIRSTDPVESDEYERSVVRHAANNRVILLQIAEDPELLKNVRAVATRLFIGMTQPSDSHYLLHGRDRLSTHSSPMIRLGAAMGFAEKGDDQRVRLMQNDPHPVVQEEVEDLLEELDM